MEDIKLTIKDYRKIKKIIKNDTNDKHYVCDFETKDYDMKSKEFWLIRICNALNIKDIEKRYDYIYETMCTILDDISHKVCDFKCDKCVGNRSGKSVHKINGCCYFHNVQCPFLVEGVCQHRSLSCKIFLCMKVESDYRFKSRINTYPLLKYFFNNKQKDIIHYSYRQVKENVLPNLLKYYK